MLFSIAPERIDIYTAAPIRGQSATCAGTRECAASARCRANEASGWSRAPLRGLRAALCRLAGTGGFAVLRFLRLFGAIRDYLEIRTSLLGGPSGQHLALQPGVISARGLQRALRDGKLDALALQACAELVDAPFRLGAIGAGLRLDLGDAVGERLDLLVGVAKRGLARLQSFRQVVRPLHQRRAPLFELASLTLQPIARGREPLDDLLGIGARDIRFYHLALQDPDVLGAGDESLAHLGKQLLRGGGTRTQRFQTQV